MVVSERKFNSIFKFERYKTKYVPIGSQNQLITKEEFYDKYFQNSQLFYDWLNFTLLNDQSHS